MRLGFVPRFVLVAAVLLGGCGGAPPSSSHVVHYTVDWDRAGVTPVANGAGWEVTNDLGYRVRVTRGYLTTYSMELVECAKAAAASPLDHVVTVLGRLIEATASAGHSSGTPNPAAIRPMCVESLLEPTAREVGTVLLSPQVYCQLHYLVARAGHDSPGLPADLDMVDASLHLEGTFGAPGSAAVVPFAIHTAVANGALIDHTTTSVPIHLDTGRAAARVTVHRYLGSLFDGVDFTATAEPTQTQQVRGGQILQSLVGHATIDIALLE